MDGAGHATAGTGAFSLPVTFPSRIGEGDGKTTPEELLAASHAVCYAMGLAATLGRLGAKANSVRVSATVTADKGEKGIQIQSSALNVTVEGLEGLDAGRLQDIANTAEAGCPISNALRASVKITVHAATA
jgi:osmotically inducible protein OsmC